VAFDEGLKVRDGGMAVPYEVKVGNNKIFGRIKPEVWDRK